MLKRENYTSEHIDVLRKQTGADPTILERTVFAFGLLEALCRVKMPFIFKGGTSLLILLDEPRRLGVSDPEAYKDFAFTLKGMKRINYIRSVDSMAYAYLVKALQLLQPQGFFTDSIL